MGLGNRNSAFPGCSLAVDLDGWTLSPEPQRPESPARKLWRLAVGEIRRAR